MEEDQPRNDEEAGESGRELVELGADGLAGLAGGAAGAFLGPVGAIAGGLATPVLGRLLGSAGRAIQRRLLTRNEEVRIGGALAVALARIKEREATGETPRGDGLFDPESDPRGMLEGTLLLAARSYDEKKVPFIGAFYASFVFESNISIHTGHFLLNLLDRLPYHSLCVLAYLNDPASNEERGRVQRAAEVGEDKLTATLQAELSELANLGLVGAWQGNPREVKTLGETYATFGGGVSILGRNASLLALLPLASTLVRMAELNKIPSADKAMIGAEFRGEDTRYL